MIERPSKTPASKTEYLVYYPPLPDKAKIMKTLVGSLGLGNLGWTKVTYVVYPHR